MSSTVKNEENISIVERILRKTQNPKIAAVLALDLILVGVDTVSEPNEKFVSVYSLINLSMSQGVVEVVC